MPHLVMSGYKVDVGKVVCIVPVGSKGKGARTSLLLKPQSSIIHYDGEVIPPKGCAVIGCIPMLALAVGERIDRNKRGKAKCLLGYGMALHLFDRASLSSASEEGLPWAAASGHDTFCPVSDFTSAEEVEDLSALELYVMVNGKEAIRTDTGSLVMRIDEALSLVSRTMTLHPGDIIGISFKDAEMALSHGDLMEGGISAVGLVRNKVRTAKGDLEEGAT